MQDSQVRDLVQFRCGYAGLVIAHNAAKSVVLPLLHYCRGSHLRLKEEIGFKLPQQLCKRPSDVLGSLLIVQR